MQAGVPTLSCSLSQFICCLETCKEEREGSDQNMLPEEQQETKQKWLQSDYSVPRRIRTHSLCTRCLRRHRLGVSCSFSTGMKCPQHGSRESPLKHLPHWRWFWGDMRNHTVSSVMGHECHHHLHAWQMNYILWSSPNQMVLSHYRFVQGRFWGECFHQKQTLLHLSSLPEKGVRHEPCLLILALPTRVLEWPRRLLSRERGEAALEGARNVGLNDDTNNTVSSEDHRAVGIWCCRQAFTGVESYLCPKWQDWRKFWIWIHNLFGNFLVFFFNPWTTPDSQSMTVCHTFLKHFQQDKKV